MYIARAYLSHGVPRDRLRAPGLCPHPLRIDKSVFVCVCARGKCVHVCMILCMHAYRYVAQHDKDHDAPFPPLKLSVEK